MSSRFAIAFASFVVLACASIGCGKKDETSNVKVIPGSTAPPSMGSIPGASDAKTCCDALMAGVASTDVEESDAFRRAGTLCVQRVSEGASRADVITAVQSILPADKLPSGCK